ncbi:MAG: ribbon-helix-helix domain-containing protein [Phycisphaerae bacterium]
MADNNTATTVRLTPPQTKRLRRLAQQLCVPVSVLMRIAVQKYLEDSK